MRVLSWLLILSAGIAAAGCNSAAKEEPPSPTPVRVAIATAGPAAPTIRTSGMLVNKDEIRLSFKVGGVIRQLAVMEGEQVRKGQKLGEIEQTEVNAQLEQARQAQQKAVRDAERGERLYADKVISLEQLQDLRTQSAVAGAALKSAEFNSSYATIVAPDDGTVLRRLAQEREVVAAGSPVLVLGAQNRGFVVRAGLADRDIVQIKLGDLAQIQIDAMPDVQLPGKVAEVASGAEPSSGMFMVEVALDSANLSLKSGLVARLQIVPSSATVSERVYVPIGAIVEGNGRDASVFVLSQKHTKEHNQKHKVQRRAVQVAFIDRESVALASGIKAGEQVITDGALYLEDGEQVAVQEAS